MMEQDMGASLRDRATAVEPVPVSPLRDGIPSAIWVVWASEGEYSDRTEWPVLATVDQDSAEMLVVRLTELWRSADQKWRKIEPDWYDRDAADAFWRDDPDAAEYERLTGGRGWFSGCYSDERSFAACSLELLSASAIEARRAATGTGAVHESAVPQADAQTQSED